MGTTWNLQLIITRECDISNESSRTRSALMHKESGGAVAQSCRQPRTTRSTLLQRNCGRPRETLVGDAPTLWRSSIPSWKNSRAGFISSNLRLIAAPVSSLACAHSRNSINCHARHGRNASRAEFN